MINKDQLQKELLEKVKKGIKPSDLKKQRGKNTNPDEGYESDNSLSLNKSQLEKEIKFWSQTANNHLTNLQREQAENEDLKEEVKELKKIKPTRTQKELEKALIEANQKIRDQEKTISDLDYLLKSGKNSEIMKGLQEKISKLQDQNQQLIEKYSKEINQLKSKGNIKETVSKKSTQDQATQTPNWNQEVSQKYYLFTCDICEQNKRSKLHYGKVNGLGIDPTKTNKICDYCIKKVDIIKDTEKEYIWE